MDSANSSKVVYGQPGYVSLLSPAPAGFFEAIARKKPKKGKKMCDMYGHGHYWRVNERWQVYLNFKENSHSLQRNNHPFIPVSAKKCGFDPVNGKAVSNDSDPLPTEVAETIEMIFVSNFPDRKSISKWIRQNFGANNDREEWTHRLAFMLSRDGAKNLYTIEYCEQQAKDWEQRAKYWEQQAKDWEQQAKYWEQQAKDWEQRAKYWEQRAKYWEQQVKYWEQRAKYWEQQAKDWEQRAKDWEQQAKDCEGEIECSSPEWLDHFFALFDECPNDYWSEKNIPAERNYEPSVLIEI